MKELVNAPQTATPVAQQVQASAQADNRTSTVQAKGLLEAIAASPRQVAQRAAAEAIDSSPRQVAQRAAVEAIASSQVVQLQKSPGFYRVTASSSLLSMEHKAIRKIKNGDLLKVVHNQGQMSNFRELNSWNIFSNYPEVEHSLVEINGETYWIEDSSLGEQTDLTIKASTAAHSSNSNSNSLEANEIKSSNSNNEEKGKVKSPSKPQLLCPMYTIDEKDDTYTQKIACNYWVVQLQNAAVPMLTVPLGQDIIDSVSKIIKESISNATDYGRTIEEEIPKVVKKAAEYGYDIRDQTIQKILTNMMPSYVGVGSSTVVGSRGQSNFVPDLDTKNIKKP